MTSRLPSSEPTLDEIDKFKALVVLVVSNGEDTYIPCADEQEAKRLRRRFYRLRDRLSPFEQQVADRVVFSCVGRRLRCSLRSNWTERPLNIGAT